MEQVRMSDLYKVRQAVRNGKQTVFSLVEIDQLIVDATLHDFVSPAAREKVERALNDGIDSQTARGSSTLH